MIFKIQRPLMTNGDEPMALIYNRNRKFQTAILVEMVLELFTPDEFKIYADVKIEKKKLIIRDLLPEQDF